MYSRNPTPRTLWTRTFSRKRVRAGEPTFSRLTLPPLDRPTGRPDHEVNVKVPSCSPPRSPSFSSVSSTTMSSSCRRNPRRRRQSYSASCSHNFHLMRRHLPSNQLFFANYGVNPTLDGGVFHLDNGVPAGKIHSVSDDGLTLGVKSSHSLVSAPWTLIIALCARFTLSSTRSLG